MRRPRCVALVASLCLAGCVSASPQDRTALTRPDLTDLLAQLQRNPIGPGEDLRITTLVESREMSGIPAGLVHTFTNTGPAPAVFFVVTTPRWDEQDRFVVKEP